jgi:hypothetical protein
VLVTFLEKKVNLPTIMITSSHHILILNFFSEGDKFQSEGSQFNPKALASATAISNMPPLPRWRLLGRPEIFKIIDNIVKIPGVHINSAFTTCSACTQMGRCSGQGIIAQFLGSVSVDQSISIDIGQQARRHLLFVGHQESSK